VIRDSGYYHIEVGQIVLSASTPTTTIVTIKDATGGHVFANEMNSTSTVKDRSWSPMFIRLEKGYQIKFYIRVDTTCSFVEAKDTVRITKLSDKTPKYIVDNYLPIEADGGPDYAMMESINHMPNYDSTWTVNQDGYIRVGHNHSAGNRVTELRILINGKVVSGVTAETASTEYSGYYTVLKVSKNDTVSFQVPGVNTWANGYFVCNYIPPKKARILLQGGGGSGSVNSVNDIDVDNTGNVQTEYVFNTEEEFEAAKDSLPVNATIIKTYSYPENAMGFMAVPDYAKMETINRIPTSGGTWTVDRDGYVRCETVATGSSQVGIQIMINGQRITGNYVYPVTQFDNIVVHPVCRGDVVQVITIGTSSSNGCYFIPIKYVATPNAVSVINKLTPSVAVQMGLPDYRNIESSINRLPLISSTWAVNRDGYIRVFAYGEGTTDSNNGLYFFVNDKAVLQTATKTGQRGALNDVVPVKKDDVIRFFNEAGITVTSVSALFIPPLPTTPLFVEGSDLQSSSAIGKVIIDETEKTMSVSGETALYNGTLYSINRPDKWPENVEINFGSGLYGKRFTGTYTLVANEDKGIVGSTIGTTKIVSYSGRVGYQTDGFVSIPYTYSVSGSVQHNVRPVFINNTFYVYTYKIDAIPNPQPYDIWITYTK
jgi:hypothetical protein